MVGGGVSGDTGRMESGDTERSGIEGCGEYGGGG